jgi:hypothetical protein
MTTTIFKGMIFLEMFISVVLKLKKPEHITALVVSLYCAYLVDTKNNKVLVY